MKIICNLLCLLLLSQFTFAQSRAAQIDAISKEIFTKNPQVAISIGFIDKGKEYFFNYGKINRQSNLEVNKNTIYEIGSITKLLTANLIAQAQQEGKLNVNDLIGKYLPTEYNLPKEIRNKIKISDLASHQSGLPDFDFKKLMQTKPQQPLDVTKKTLHAILNNSTKLLDYGNYRYSNISYTLMGIILEEVYAKNFTELVKEKILDPAQMKNTFTSNVEGQNKVCGYDINGVEQEYFKWNSWTGPAGLLKSNTADMVKLLDILLSNNGKIANATKITEATYYQNTKREVGLGQEIARSKEDKFFYKTGDTFACSSIMAYNKKEDWGMVILINQHNSDLIRELFNTNYEQVLE
ncbi:serine hydrolase domain-containing protein [Haloflavibacter putidus]|uniref:Beta-lactamase family protein n=1 Tax=Haloflavibacter putidus TaxID=2576776 RepID=A0A507ZIZ1_9FLAO|nr:serine hydrolase domain-containing protein [Haloflavibacter putidus]TQD36947.1 beta-lactamase family protein [Haloflavibacter putidus]